MIFIKHWKAKLIPELVKELREMIQEHKDRIIHHSRQVQLTTYQ